MKIIQVETPETVAVAQAIFREYEAWLGLDLCFQGFEDELAALPGKYAPPDGRLFLAYLNDDLAGCIALRKLEDNICEMKRLFVKEDFRGKHIGQMLIERLIEDARSQGYEKMRLDTYPPKMHKAVGLYESYGFCRIPPYYNNPQKHTLFMELPLN
jgi:ribosomal protein S18 acetylase RimI-like enzyme